MQTERDEQKRKAIEEAEAILEQSDPAATNEPAAKEINARPHPAEDTIEMTIPVEQQVAKKPSESPSMVKSQPEEDHKAVTDEIELEAIETSIEMLTTDAEGLFLSEVESKRPSELQKSDSTEPPTELTTPPETTVEQSDPMVKSDSDVQEKKDEKNEDIALKQTKTEPAAANQPEADQKKNESAETPPESAEPEEAGNSELSKNRTSAAEMTEPASTEAQPAATAKSTEEEVLLDEKIELTMAKDQAVRDTAQTSTEATIEMPKESVKENRPQKRQEIEVKAETQKQQQEAQVKEALQMQRENKAKTEALKKQKAAKAAALKKKKLARLKAEALKKQKTAQAKAEAAKKNKAQAKAKIEDKKKATRTEVLKKQKEAQAKAEASTQDFQVAINGVAETASQATDAGLSNHARLLSLLKKYKGRAIGINYDNSSEIKAAELVDANEEFFSVMVKDKKLQYSYPLKNILTIVEGQEGVETGEDDQKLKFDAVIKVYPLVAF